MAGAAARAARSAGRRRHRASRWSGSPQQPYEVTSEIDRDLHVLAIALKSTTLTMFAARRLVHDGRMMSGAAVISHPAQTLRAIFHGAYDELHFHVPNALIGQYVDADQTDVGNDDLPLYGAPARSDSILNLLAHAFIRAEELDEPFGHGYAEDIALAIIARGLGRSPYAGSLAGWHGGGCLQRWRLKRVLEYIEAYLGSSTGLSDIAAVAALPPMHFAAQFRVATGMRSHEYLPHRRTEHARTLLTTFGLPLVEIALDAGFKSQSHFTTVFRHITGETPGR